MSHALDVRIKQCYSLFMVTKELIELDIKQAQDLITAARLERRAAGNWVLILDFDGNVFIDEHRSVGYKAEVRVSGKQRGRKPLPQWEAMRQNKGKIK